MRSAYRGLAHAIATAVVLQAAFIAYAYARTLADVEDAGGKAVADNIGQVLHGVVGSMIVPLLGLALLVVAVRAGIPGGLRWAGLLFAAIVGQVVLGFATSAVPALGALHGVVAFVVLGLAVAAGHCSGTGQPTRRDEL